MLQSVMHYCLIDFVNLFLKKFVFFSGLKMSAVTFSVAETNHIISTDQNPRDVHKYSPDIQPLITQYWNEFNTVSITDPQLLANCVRFRFGNGAPNVQNYIPTTLGAHPSLITFIRSILHNDLRFQSFSANFSISFALSDADGVRFIYHSHNFQCLPIAKEVFNQSTKIEFLRALSQFNLQEYTEETLKVLSDKYDNILVSPLSINVSIVRNRDQIWGSSPTSTNCMFESFSQLYIVDNHGKLTKFAKPKQRPNKRNAIRLRGAFCTWVRKKKCIPATQLFTAHGIKQQALHLVEEFFSTSIHIFCRKQIRQTKAMRLGIKAAEKKKFVTIKTRNSDLLFPTLVNLWSTGTKNHHVQHVVLMKPTFSDFGRHNQSKHFVCTLCNWSFDRKHDLIRHSKVNCQKKRKHISGKVIEYLPSLDSIRKTMFPLNPLVTDNCCATVQISINHKSLYEVKIDYVQSNITSQINPTTFEHADLFTCAHFVVHFLSNVSVPDRVKRIRQNEQLLAAIAKKVSQNQVDVGANQKIFTSSFEYKEKRKLDAIREHTVNYMALFPVFVIVKKSNQILSSMLLEKILGVFIKNSPTKKPFFQIKSGFFAYVKGNGLNFVNTHTIVPFHTENNKNNVEEFLSLAKNIKKDFNCDILASEYTSTTKIAQSFFSEYLTCSQKNGFMSPPPDLFEQIEKSAKYGYLYSKISYIHPNMQYRSFMSCDFSKFYANMASIFNPYLGQPMVYERRGTQFVKTSKRLPHFLFANLVFSTLKMLCEGDFLYQTLGPEARVNHLPVDCLVTTTANSAPIVINFSGCYFHACGNLCHQPASLPPSHHESCPICVEAAKKDYSTHRPKLWRLKTNENFLSSHPHKKITYEAVQNKSQQINEIIAKSPHINRFCEIKECEILQYWSRPCGEFVQSLGLKLKHPSEATTPLKHCFSQAVSLDFPVTRHNKITMQKVITAFKENKIHGFAIVSGSFGPKTTNLLQDFPVFSSLDKDGKMVNSNCLQNQMLTGQFISYLLNPKKELTAPDDFFLTDIKKLFLYTPVKDTPFARPVMHILQSLEQTGSNCDSYKSFRKNLTNFFLGGFRTNITKNKNALLMSKQEFQHLNSRKKFISAHQITEKEALAFFKDTSSFFNSSQNHFGIILLARSWFLRTVISLSRFLHFNIATCNTDGMTCQSENQFSSAINPSTKPIFYLDSWLKPNLTHLQITQYVCMKKSLFTNVLVCSEHLQEYYDNLKCRMLFEPKKCCLDLPDNTFGPKLRIEGFGDKGIIAGNNKHLLFQRYGRTATLKFSGKKATPTSFLDGCPKHMAELFKDMVK